LAGQAACAWFDRETDDTLHLARFNGSPLSYAWLEDGSFVFASTSEILGRALNKAGVAWFGVYPGPFDTFSNGEYLQILQGEILQEAEVEWGYSYYGTGASGSGWRTVAAASSSTTTTKTEVAKPSEDAKPMALES